MQGAPPDGFEGDVSDLNFLTKKKLFFPIMVPFTVIPLSFHCLRGPGAVGGGRHR